MTKKQVDMAVYDWRPWVPDAGYFIYWNWLPDSFTNWNYAIPRRRRSVMRPLPWPSARRNARRNCDDFRKSSMAISAWCPSLRNLNNLAMRQHVQGHVYYPDAIPVLAKLSLG